jgi:hypothetical protein
MAILNIFNIMSWFIMLQDLSPCVVEDMLLFIYSGNTPRLSQVCISSTVPYITSSL